MPAHLPVREAEDSGPERRVLAVTLLGSGLLCAGLGVAHYLSGSELARAHAADSGLDMFTAVVLLWTIHVGSKPRDADHPFGHSRAEPLGALFVAFIAGALALEVGRDAIAALMGVHALRPSWALWIFAVKAAFKLLILTWARRRRGPAMEALVVDARNDVLTCVLAGMGVLGAKLGWPALDAWLALPLAAWIAWTGIDLASDNIRRLMGASPPEARIAGIRATGAEVKGVRGIHDVRAHYLGTRLSVHLHVLVDESLTVREAHDIGEEVRLRVEADEEVAHCSVHIDVEEPAELA